MKSRVLVTVVIPFYNEEDVLPELIARLEKLTSDVDFDAEFLFVDDGSSDDGTALIESRAHQDHRFKLIAFSRNFGHQAAVSAGLKAARGDYACVIDADLQDPPELILDMLKIAQEGVDVVYAVRRTREAIWWKAICYRIYYRLLQFLSETKIPLDSGDFCLLSRRAFSEINRLPERVRFVRGLRSWVGFRQQAFYFDRPGRHAGEPKYDFRRLLALACDGIFAFSTKPLRLASYLGFVISLLCSFYVLYAVIWRFYSGENLPGFAALAVGVFFLGGVQLLTIGILGEYVARIYLEVKQRPSFVVARRVPEICADPPAH